MPTMTSFSRLLVACLLTACLLGCSRPSPEADRQALLDDINASIADAVALLETQQSSDGAYRSQTYGFMRDGPTLTPHVLSALAVLPESMASDATRRGVDYLLTLDPDTTVLLQPVYTAAATSWVLRYAGHESAADPWLDLIESHQLTEQLGWPRTDPRYGGWSYATTPPRYGPDAIDATRPDANISATVFAIGALKLSDRLTARHLGPALDFAMLLRSADGGGFGFSPTDPARNKAGVIDDASERQRPFPVRPYPFRPRMDRIQERVRMVEAQPYGSATADGVRVMLACGLDTRWDQVAASRDWLVEHFRADTVPGNFRGDREPLRHGYYHYYAWSVSHALRRLGVTHAGADRDTPWAEQLALALIESQEADGAWRNRSTDGKEDDPLVATPFALATLAVCRNAMMEASE
jgi:hypothetical protein